MITAQQIEAFAVQIAEPGFEVSKASIEQLIGHLADAEFKAVMARAAEISRERGRGAFAVADTLETLTRLAHAAGCPSGIPVVPWLRERGLIEEVDGGFRFKTASPHEAEGCDTEEDEMPQKETNPLGDVLDDVDLDDLRVGAHVIYGSLSTIDFAKTTPEIFWAIFGTANGKAGTEVAQQFDQKTHRDRTRNAGMIRPTDRAW
jgi:hypothetical protein